MVGSSSGTPEFEGILAWRNQSRAGNLDASSEGGLVEAGPLDRVRPTAVDRAEIVFLI